MEEKQKKPIFKRWWFWVIAVIVVFAIAGGGDEDISNGSAEVEEPSKIEDTADLDEPELSKEPDTEEDKEVEEDKESEEDKEDPEEPEVTWDDIKDPDKIVGKSDKDYLDITDRKPSDVRNDTTGKWKKNTIAENIKIEEYALSYKNLYMNEGDVHWIINFNYNTTTRLNYLGGLLYVDIMEYQKREEHDAKKLGGGMLLESYIIYPDGDMEEVGD